MKSLRLILYPLSLLYGLVVWIRNRLYDCKVFRQKEFSMPVIVVGNLEVGGTGKSPMTEYLIRLLKDKYKLAILSRGYGRKTSGYRLVSDNSEADQSGDEPLQFKKKFPNLTVAVSESRVTGVQELMNNHDAIILDDAFQHRALKPGFSVLLFDFNRLNEPRLFLPAGNYRDSFAERKRADIIVVTKCPADLSAETKSKITFKLAVKNNTQPIFFATTKYSHLQKVNPMQHYRPLTEENVYKGISKEIQVLLITGIARPKPLVEYVQRIAPHVQHIAFKDHHRFTATDISRIQQRFEAIPGDNKIIITTEKDTARLTQEEFATVIKNWPLYYIPIELEFLCAEGEVFDQAVLGYCEQAIRS